MQGFSILCRGLQYCAGVYNIVQGFTILCGGGGLNIGVYGFNVKGLSNWL